MQLLVTGGAGFIGCAVSGLVGPDTDRYVVVDSMHPQVHPAPRRPSALHPAAELVMADVTDPATWDDLLGRFRPTHVLHLAAETGTAQSLTEASRHAAANVVGTTRLLDGLAARGIEPECVVLSSSRAVYGEGRWVRPDGSTFYPGQRSHDQLSSARWDFDGASPVLSDARTTEPRPTSVYGATKLAQEHVLQAWCSSMGVPLQILRLQNVYGPGQSLTNSYTGIVALFSQMARAGQAIPIYEDGRITRDFVYIDDVASAIASALRTSGLPGHPIDVGSGQPTTILEMARVLASMHGAPEPVINGMYRDGDVRHASCSIEAAAELLGWCPKWDLRQGLESLQDWIASRSGDAVTA